MHSILIAMWRTQRSSVFKPEGVIEEKVTQMVPIIDRELCNGCRKCINFCKFNALAYIGDRVMTFHDICHSCGGCSLVCPRVLYPKGLRLSVGLRGAYRKESM